jgi:hypothetical protein
MCHHLFHKKELEERGDREQPLSFFKGMPRETKILRVLNDIYCARISRDGMIWLLAKLMAGKWGRGWRGAESYDRKKAGPL